jgi:hypothetical protein
MNPNKQKCPFKDYEIINSESFKLRYHCVGYYGYRKPDEIAEYPHETHVFQSHFVIKIFNYCLN